jgi:hypothetical protein
MKEYPESDYLITIRSLVAADSVDLQRLIPNGCQVTLGGVVDMGLVPTLASAPWPPPVPRSYDHWETSDRAAEYVFATSDVTLTAWAGDQVMLKVAKISELEHSAFFLPMTQFEAIRNDIHVLQSRAVADEPIRLSAVRRSAFGRFLESELPKATVNAYARRILCI